MCMYVCMYVRMYVCMYVCVCVIFHHIPIHHFRLPLQYMVLRSEGEADVLMGAVLQRAILPKYCVCFASPVCHPGIVLDA